MSLIRLSFESGARAARVKFALGPPTQVDQFVADVEHGQDIPPQAALPPMSQPSGSPAALDGTMPLSTSPPTPQDTIGSTVGQPPPPLPGDPAAQPPPSMGALRT